jgi:FtsP/CotA-like multicopper oxidase with cupredoxin domain
MKKLIQSRRQFMKLSGITVGALLLPPEEILTRTGLSSAHGEVANPALEAGAADYTLHIKAAPIEIAPKHIISLTTYNGQFPGPLLRFKEGEQVTVDVFNETDMAEQLHWHGQKIPTDVDGSADEGTPFIPAQGKRRIVFAPNPSGFRFYHTHVRAGANLAAGLYNAELGPVYIEPKNEPGRYDREVFLVLKEFEPNFSIGGSMPKDFLSPATRIKSLEDEGESAMKASLAKGMPQGYDVNYGAFTINGKMLGHGEPIRVKQSERVLFHILNGSATEIRSLALPGHTFLVVALDGNPVPNPARVPVLWLGTAERISAIVEMNEPGVWILGDLDDGNREKGMGIIVEYSGHSGKPTWTTPAPFRWSYKDFATIGRTALPPDETIELKFAKENAAVEGFNRWTINGSAFPMSSMAGETPQASFHLRQGHRYRLRFRNASDDIHPIHLHRHTFELTRLGGNPTAGVFKDVVMLGAYQEIEVDFVADNPGLTLFHCHMQLHMDFGFMALFDYIQ